MNNLEPNSPLIPSSIAPSAPVLPPAELSKNETVDKTLSDVGHEIFNSISNSEPGNILGGGESLQQAQKIEVYEIAGDDFAALLAGAEKEPDKPAEALFKPAKAVDVLKDLQLPAGSKIFVLKKLASKEGEKPANQFQFLPNPTFQHSIDRFMALPNMAARINGELFARDNISLMNPQEFAAFKTNLIALARFESNQKSSEDKTKEKRLDEQAQESRQIAMKRFQDAMAPKPDGKKLPPLPEHILHVTPTESQHKDARVSEKVKMEELNRENTLRQALENKARKIDTHVFKEELKRSILTESYQKDLIQEQEVKLTENHTVRQIHLEAPLLSSSVG